MIAVPHVLIADEAEKVIDDASARRRDLDLLGVGAHREMLADVVFETANGIREAPRSDKSVEQIAESPVNA